MTIDDRQTEGPVQPQKYLRQTVCVHEALRKSLSVENHNVFLSLGKFLFK